MEFGFPVKYVEQTLDEASLEKYSSQVYKHTIAPRYDKYETRIVAWKLVISVALNSVGIFLIYLLFSKRPKLGLKILKYLAIALIITVIGMILPAAPGTFTIDDLDPMHFGWPLKSVEMTGDGSIYTYEEADRYLAQAYIAPRYDIYKTHIVTWKVVVNVIMIAVFIAAVWNILRVFVLYLKGGTAKIKKYYSEKYLRLLPKDELTKRLEEKKAKEEEKLPKKRFKTLD